jgi:hypothetical protein
MTASCGSPFGRLLPANRALVKAPHDPEAGYRAPAAPPSSSTSGTTTGDAGVGEHDASHSNVPRVNGTSASNSGAPLLNTSLIWQVPTLSSEMEIMPESKEAFAQAPVAVTDRTSPIRSAGTETPNAPSGQLHTIGVLPLEPHAVIMSKETPANALNRFMARTLAPASRPTPAARELRGRARRRCPRRVTVCYALASGCFVARLSRAHVGLGAINRGPTFG